MIDLHLHSTYSDGTFTPGELVRTASRRNLSAISITDHDTIDATVEAFREGAVCGVTVIPGVELSVYLGDVHFHLLGYNFDHSSSRLREGLAVLQRSRNTRNQDILLKLRRLGIDISENELQDVSLEGQTGRPHIARLLVEKKKVKTIDQAFRNYLRKGACAYVSRTIFSAREAIDLINDAGGLSVLAHPAQISYSIDKLRPLLKQLMQFGLDGIEVIYPSQVGRFRKRLRALAADFGLLQTGGSDYHGDIRPGTSMAGEATLCVPDTVVEKMQEHISKKTEKNRIRRNSHDYEYNSRC